MKKKESWIFEEFGKFLSEGFNKYLGGYFKEKISPLEKSIKNSKEEIKFI